MRSCDIPDAVMRRANNAGPIKVANAVFISSFLRHTFETPEPLILWASWHLSTYCLGNGTRSSKAYVIATKELGLSHTNNVKRFGPIGISNPLPRVKSSKVGNRA
jgi:hypothetical protein